MPVAAECAQGLVTDSGPVVAGGSMFETSAVRLCAQEGQRVEARHMHKLAVVEQVGAAAAAPSTDSADDPAMAADGG